METNFNFKSSVCTSRSQSERLIALGLKKETADCSLNNYSLKGKNYQDDWQVGTVPYCKVLEEWNKFAKDSCWELIPAWSLGRLIKDLMPQSIGHLELAVGSDYVGYYEDRCESESGMWWEYSSETSDMFNNIISTIEWLIKEGYFNKEYLEETL